MQLRRLSIIIGNILYCYYYFITPPRTTWPSVNAQGLTDHPWEPPLTYKRNGEAIDL